MSLTFVHTADVFRYYRAQKRCYVGQGIYHIYPVISGKYFIGENRGSARIAGRVGLESYSDVFQWFCAVKFGYGACYEYPAAGPVVE